MVCPLPTLGSHLRSVPLRSWQPPLVPRPSLVPPHPKSIALSPPNTLPSGDEEAIGRGGSESALCSPFSLLPRCSHLPPRPRPVASPWRDLPTPRCWGGSSCGPSGMSGHKMAARSSAPGRGLPALSLARWPAGWRQPSGEAASVCQGGPDLWPALTPLGPSQSVSPWPLFSGSHG